ncbi:2,3-bisphosphoglycerate-dependent phosphoglycerate mutase [Candidatus Burarchaeum australiense]|nr:2,3-bisphosphoglycerate-dependent phosphoglycerate mutase [Candidatus Burarchaeum australiense]
MVDTIFLVRHAESEANKDRVYAGWSDSKLTALGMQQAESLKKRLGREGIGRVFSSDLERVRNTLGCLDLKCPVEFSSELRERNYGALEGTKWEDDPLRQKHHFDPLIRPPGGESAKDVQLRTWHFFQKKVFMAQEEKVLVVSHHTPLVTFICKFLGMPLNRWRAFRLGNAGLCILINEDGLWRVSLWNSMSALGLQNYGPLLENKK